MSDENNDNNLPSREAVNGRDPVTGRLLPGHKLAKGNPHHKKAMELKAAVMDAVTKEDMVAIIRKAVDQAKKGDKAARDFVFDRVLGKPVQSIEADVTSTQLNPDEARERVGAFFGIRMEK